MRSSSPQPATNEEHMLVNTRRYQELLGTLDLSEVTVVEFGAGDGALTALILARKPKKVIAYELNEMLAQTLKSRLDSPALDVKIADFTQEDFTYLSAGKHVIISNPPYSTIPFLVKHVIHPFHLQDVMLMTSAKHIAKYFSGYQVAFTLTGRDFSPRADGDHFVMQKGFETLKKRPEPKLYESRHPVTRLFPVNDSRVAIACSRSVDKGFHNRADRSQPRYMQRYMSCAYSGDSYDFVSNGWPVDRHFQPRVLSNGLLVHIDEPLPQNPGPYCRDPLPTALRSLNGTGLGDDGWHVNEALDSELSAFMPQGKSSGWLFCTTAKHHEIFAYHIASTHHLAESFSLPINGFNQTIDAETVHASLLNSGPRHSFCLYKTESSHQLIRDLAVIKEEKGSQQLAVLLNTGEVQIGEMIRNQWVLKTRLQISLTEKSGKTRLFYSASQQALLIQDGHRLHVHRLNNPEEGSGLHIPRLFNVSLSCSGNYLTGLIDNDEPSSSYLQIIDLTELKSKNTFTPHMIFLPLQMTGFVIGFEDRVCVASGNSLRFYPSLAVFLQDRYQLLQNAAPKPPREDKDKDEYDYASGSEADVDLQSESKSINSCLSIDTADEPDSPASLASTSPSSGYGLFSLFGKEETSATNPLSPQGEMGSSRSLTHLG